ncbi:MAG: hypothetical protein ACTSXO_12060 [Candidatus Heimdallarchaeota archaeon]
MAEKNKRLRLIGKLLTPIVIEKPTFYIKGCRVTITKKAEEKENGRFAYPEKLFYGKLVKDRRRPPTVKTCFQGFVVVDCPGTNNQAKKKLQWFFDLDGLGRQQNEGMGRIRWLQKKEVAYVKKEPPKKKLRIRKGLGYYPKPMVRAITALLLHDFVHTEKHDSKIYHEVEITDELMREACKKHHQITEENENWLIPIIQKYDRLAALINRKKPLRKEKRYDYENGAVNCKQIAELITEKQKSIDALYNYIYYDKQFARFYEAINYANNSSLRKHLLLAVNLLINDFKKGRLVIKNNKVMIVSTPARDKRETEKHLSKPKVLKRTYPPKKGAESKIAALQERPVEEKNHPKNTEKSHLRRDT